MPNCDWEERSGEEEPRNSSANELETTVGRGAVGEFDAVESGEHRSGLEGEVNSAVCEDGGNGVAGVAGGGGGVEVEGVREDRGG